MKKYKYELEFYFDQEISINKNKNFQTDDEYKKMLKCIQGLLEHCENLSEIKITRVEK